MTLTLYDFNVLNDRGKGEAVVMKGIFIDDRDEDALKVQLYRLNAFYVEVYYDPFANRVVRYRAFNSLRNLAAYIKLSF